MEFGIQKLEHVSIQPPDIVVPIWYPCDVLPVDHFVIFMGGADVPSVVICKLTENNLYLSACACRKGLGKRDLFTILNSGTRNVHA